MAENSIRPESWPDIDVCTLGMFIIDEIHFGLSKPSENDYAAPTKQIESKSSTTGAAHSKVLHNIMGGAGSYTTLGARICLTHAKSKRAGWIVDCGSDFPPAMRTQIDTWGTSCLFRETPERLTTRGWNGYGAGSSEQRAFRYLTPKLRLDGDSLTPGLLLSATFHLICSSSRCISLVEGILKRREALIADLKERDAQIRDRWQVRPLFIWEPVPNLCTVEEWESCKQALKVVDCVSPNHVELAGFFGSENEMEDGNGNVKREEVEELAKRLIDEGIGRNGSGSVVVRVGMDGCVVRYRGLERPIWLPAYHSTESGKVLDPTGGGNTFLGGLAAAMADRCNVETSAAAGSITAGVAIEQIGMPAFDVEGDKWNGMSFSERCELYQRRLSENGSKVNLDVLAHKANR